MDCWLFGKGEEHADGCTIELALGLCCGSARLTVTGVSAGNDDTPGYVAEIARTTDGGKTWKQVGELHTYLASSPRYIESLSRTS
jgi:photosystem II stability/assembly factor-like uncharacterized protein